MCARKHAFFEFHLNNVLFQSFRSLSTGTLQNSCALSPIENEETLHQIIFDACKTI